MSPLASVGRPATARPQSPCIPMCRRASKASTVAALALALCALSACNTLGGAGKDLESAGDAIADTNESTSD